MTKSNHPTIESLDKLVNQVNALANEIRKILYPHGKPDWMTPEQWSEITGEKEGQNNV